MQQPDETSELHCQGPSRAVNEHARMGKKNKSKAGSVPPPAEADEAASEQGSATANVATTTVSTLEDAQQGTVPQAVPNDSTSTTLELAEALAEIKRLQALLAERDAEIEQLRQVAQDQRAASLAGATATAGSATAGATSELEALREKRVVAVFILPLHDSLAFVCAVIFM
jgi:hypothetical protein